MKKLLFLGSLSFTVAFVLGIIVEKNITKSVVIAGIATISTVGSTFALDQKSQGELKDKQNELKNQVLMLENKEMRLSQLIESKTKEKIAIEQEYSSSFEQVNTLKQEINDLALQRDDLESEISKIETNKTTITQQTTVKPAIASKEKTGLYNCILKGLEDSGNFYNPQVHGTFEQYLQSLKQSAKQLWSSYRSSQVKVNYSDTSIQAAYLIRYYPHYAYMNFQILDILHNNNLFQYLTNDTLEVCLFGAGPCPEIVGLCHLLSQQYQNIKNLIVNDYDIAANEWSLSRDITEKFIIPESWSGGFKLNSNYLDLCQSNSLKLITTKIKKSNLFIFQNCLNEIYNVTTVQENLNFLLDQISLNSVIIISDLSNYRQNFSIIEQINNQVNNRCDFEIYPPQIEAIQVKPYSEIPATIKENLLTGESGLIARTTNINCLFISLRKIK
jgi:hypothetical protein